METTKDKPCPSCSVAVSEYHRHDCILETCPYCGHDLHSCMMRPKGCPRNPTPFWPPPLDDRIPWNGRLIGVQECCELGWFAKNVAGKMVPCYADDPGALPDIKRLHREAYWDRRHERFTAIRRVASTTKPASQPPPIVVVPPKAKVIRARKSA